MKERLPLCPSLPKRVAISAAFLGSVFAVDAIGDMLYPARPQPTRTVRTCAVEESLFDELRCFPYHLTSMLYGHAR